MADAEADLLEGIPLPGTPTEEAERRKEWLKIPRTARIAIRRMHRQFGHKTNAVLVQILRAAKAPKDHIDAARHFRCDHCVTNSTKPQTQKVTAPKPYVFNEQVGIDVLYVKDATGES